MPVYTSKETIQRRKKQRKAKQFAFISAVVAFILLFSFGVTQLITTFTKTEEEPNYFIQPEETQTPIENNDSAILGPNLILEDKTILSSNSYNLALPENGRVFDNYFDDALFLGDSLGDGFREYQTTTGIDTATFFTNRNLQPSSFLNGGYVSIPGYDDPIDALLEIKNIAPGKIYVILGTNAMNLSDEDFLNYYSQLIDELKLAAPESVIYINSLLPVTQTTSSENDIYNPQRIINLNTSLAKMASQKTVCFLNVYEIFATSEGHLNEDLAYNDGIHLTPTGYKNWTDYLISHTYYSDTTPFVQGSPYFIS